MIYSKHNIFSRIKDSENYFLVNLLTGHADVVNPGDALKIERIRKGEEPDDADLLHEMKAKGYIADEAEERRLYVKKYLDFMDGRATDEIQLFYVPGYGCNFACSYCYQDAYVPATRPMTLEEEKLRVDAFFSYVSREFAGKRKYITVFGGEPLLNAPRQKELIGYLLQKAGENRMDVCFVTNGYTLADYIEILKKGRIREIQVTLDGTAPVHDKRRFLKGGAGTFDRIVNGVDACLQNGLLVNLRMVIDKENILNLPDFAQFAIDKGWTSSPLFKTQIGRNYELHHCQSSPDHLFSRVSLYESLYQLIEQHPHILEFYKPAYSVSKFLSENGTLPDPLFDSCPACKTEWAFDYTGRIYPCTATVGKEGEALGTFYPEVRLDAKLVGEWEKRDVTSISDCTNCSLQLACGGGCGSVAKNNSGKVCSTDCRPVKELLELGFASYF